MNWDDLRFVVEIGRAGTLAAAARRLKVDQTTVARRLRALEEELGAALFERGAGHWQPTAVGKDVLQRAGRIEEDVTALLRVAEAGAGTVNGLVRVTAVGTLIADYLAPRLTGLYARHPDLSIELIASNNNLNVARREADIAIRLARPTRGDFLIRKLADSGFAVYGSARHGQDAANDWVAYLDDLAHTPEMQALESLRGDGRIRLRSGNIRGLMRAVAGGIGRGILPCFLADPEPGLQRLSGPEPVLNREIWLLVHPDARQQARVAATADWLAECFANDGAIFRGELQSPTRVDP